MDSDWWKAYFDEDFLRFHKDRPYQNTAEELKLLGSILGRPRGRWLLDACCGPGRHSIPLSRKGWRVVGLDFSQNLLEQARSASKHPGETTSHSPHWVRGDLRYPPFRAAFDVALSMWTSIGYFDTDLEHRLLLQSIHDCLKPGGIFVLDLANRDCLIQHPGVLRNWWKRGEAFVLEKTSFDPTTSIATTTNVLIEGGDTQESVYRVRLFSLHEIVTFLGEIGFSIEKGYGGYDGKPLGFLSQRMVLVARKSL